MEILAPPTMAVSGPRRLVEHFFEGFQLRLQGTSGIGLQQTRYPCGGRVRAVRHREGVVDENVAKLGQRGDEGRIVLLFARVKAGVLQTDDVAILHRRHRAFGGFADAVVDELTGRLMMCATSAATGLSEFLRSRPFGRPKCESRITLAPLSAISVIACAMRSMRVPSVTTPFSTGTLRSARTSTRLPFTSAWSRVRNAVIIRSGSAVSDQLAHRHGGVRHAVGEAPLVVVPRHHAHQRAIHHLGLVHVEDRGMRIVVEVDGDVGLRCVAEDAFELLLGHALDRAVDLVLAGGALGDKFEIDHRHIGRRHADRHAVELAVEFRQHQPDRFGGAGRGRDHRQAGRARAIEIPCAWCRRIP